MSGYAAIFTLLAQLRSIYGFSEFEIGVIPAAAFLAGFFAQMSLSRLADLGRGPLLMRLGMVLSILGAAWMCVADSLAAWILARVLLGFGGRCAPRNAPVSLRLKSKQSRRDARTSRRMGNGGIFNGAHCRLGLV